MNKDNRRFQRGSGVYTCGRCGKLTRETGEHESYVEMCAKCQEICGQENLYSDGCITQEELDNAIAEIEAR